MQELFLVCAVATTFVFGYFIVKKLDTFFENNCSRICENPGVSRLSVAIENPVRQNNLTTVFEQFSRENSDCAIRLFCGDEHEIYKQLADNVIDIGLTLEPSSTGEKSITVIWKKDLENDSVKNFVAILSSMAMADQSDATSNSRI